MSTVDTSPPLDHRPQHRRRGDRRRPRDDVVIDCQIKDLHYGSFKAVRDTHDPDQEEHDHRLHRPVRLRQEHRAALPQPHERPGARLPLRGPRPLSAASDIYDADDRSGGRAPLHRHGVPAAQPVRHEHLQQRRLRPAAERLPGRTRPRRSRRRCAARRCGTR